MNNETNKLVPQITGDQLTDTTNNTTLSSITAACCKPVRMSTVAMYKVFTQTTECISTATGKQQTSTEDKQR